MQEINIVVLNEHFKHSDVPLFFNKEPVLFIDNTLDMFDILVKFNFFTSRTEAKKNWTKTDKNIPNGFSDFTKIGKLNRRLTILKSIE